MARLVPLNGAVFAALVVAATAVTAGSPSDTAPDATVTAYYADAGHRHRELLALLLVGLAGLCFLSFVGSLRGALARAEGEPHRLTTAATVSATAFITLAVAGHALSAVPAIARSRYAGSALDAATVRGFWAGAFALFVLALFAAASMCLAVAVLAFATRGVPRWLGWLAVAGAVGGVTSWWLYPSLLPLAFVVAASVWLAAGRDTPPAQAV